MFGQDLRDHDADVAVAEHFRGLHVALRFQRQRRGAREPAGERPVGQAERDQQRGEAGPEDRHDGEREDQRGDRQQQVGQAGDEIVPPAAPVAGGEAERVPITVLISCAKMPTVSEMRAPCTTRE
jgi:hypothetical protein